METIFEKAGITCTLAEDGMYYPDLKLPEDEAPHYGKYGRMRKAFLQEHRHGLYPEFPECVTITSGRNPVISMV